MSISSLPPEPPSPRQIARDFLEIPDGFFRRFEERELEGHELVIVLADGTPFFRLRRNHPGNRHNAFTTDVTYSLIFPNGDEMLVPYPDTPSVRARIVIGRDSYGNYFGKAMDKIAAEQVVVQIGNTGVVTINALPSDHGTAYKLDPVAEPDESIHHVHPYSLELHQRETTVAMAPDMVFCIYNSNGIHLGTVFQIPGAEHGYIIENHDHSKLLALDVDELQPKEMEFADGFKFSFRNEGPKIAITSFQPTSGALITVATRDHVPPGEDGRLKGFINGPCHFHAITTKEAGIVKPGYGQTDEDSVAFSRKTGRLVVSDGMGGYGNGQHSSALAARQIAEHWGSIEHSIHDAAYSLEFLNSLLAVPSDTVFAGVQLRGNRADFFSTGDARWYLIFGGKVVKQNTVRSVLEDLLRADKNRNRAELYANNPDKRNLVTTSLNSFTDDNESRKAEIISNIPIPKGATIVLTSDGCSLTPLQIAECVEGFTPDQGSERIRAHQAKMNMSDKKFPIDFGDGRGVAHVSAPRDHFTCLVYRQAY